MRFVFGPVPSRRLGQSLGIDPIPLKTCNWNCVYCQLGSTHSLIPPAQRAEYFPREEIGAEIRQVLASPQTTKIDWVTFVGSGEPTLHTGIGWLLRQAKSLTDIPVAVITNGSLLYMPQVRQDLSCANAVLPTLDSGNEKAYLKINRPHPELTFKSLVDGLISFRQEYKGQLWVEVMLLKGVNDTEASLQEIASVLQRIAPDQIHINFPTRPPSEPWVQPSDEIGLARAIEIFGHLSHVIRPAEGAFHSQDTNNSLESLLGILQRHPMEEEELKSTLEQWQPGHVEIWLQRLSESGKAQRLQQHGRSYWRLIHTGYPEDIS